MTNDSEIKTKLIMKLESRLTKTEEESKQSESTLNNKIENLKKVIAADIILKEIQNEKLLEKDLIIKRLQEHDLELQKTVEKFVQQKEAQIQKLELENEQKVSEINQFLDIFSKYRNRDSDTNANGKKRRFDD